MARFDVYRFDGAVPYVLDVQADILGHISSRVIVPLAQSAAMKSEAMQRLKPLLNVNGESFRMIATDISAVPTAQLGECVANLIDQHDVIVDAIDFLMQGF